MLATTDCGLDKYPQSMTFWIKNKKKRLIQILLYKTFFSVSRSNWNRYDKQRPRFGGKMKKTLTNVIIVNNNLLSLKER